jgi:hypothetical protein
VRWRAAEPLLNVPAAADAQGFNFAKEAVGAISDNRLIESAASNRAKTDPQVATVGT